jgi:formylglycine-generating enzyme required for sulfatase activity
MIGQLISPISTGPKAELPREILCPHDHEQRYIPSGVFTMGSTAKEREYAYGLDKEVTRRYGWYEKETRRTPRTKVFCMDRYPVTNGQYKSFVEETGHQVPTITPEAYQSQGFLVHPYDKVEEFLWREESFPAGQKDHPVVLVSYTDAVSYCGWKAKQMQAKYRLPTEEEWEKAARGTDGRIFPWGDKWIAKNLNSGSHPGSTTPVGRFPQGKSPYGLYDMVGNTFEWTSTPWQAPYVVGQAQKVVLKGCSWDDLPGTCRAAMRHGRPVSSKHILMGFRCVSNLVR